MDDKPAERLFRPFMITLGGISLSAALGFGFWRLGYRLDAADATPWVRWAAAALYAALIWAVILATTRLARRAEDVRRPTGAARRYNRRIVIAMGLYTVTLFAALVIWATARPTSVPLVLALALAPALPLLAVIGFMGLYLREEEDEFVRTVTSQSALAASGGALAVATVWGFCEMFRIAPHAPSWLAFPLWFLLFALAQPMVRLRYR